jgi:hypothetical protein
MAKSPFMKSLDISTNQGWLLGRWAVALSLALATLALVPPGSLPYPPDSNYSDAAISHWPNAYFLSESVWEYGQWPLWHPLRMLGQPFAANPLAKVWYPPQWAALILPSTIHLDLMIYLHMMWLGLGMFAWLRSERLHLTTAFLAAIAWGLNPKLFAHLGAGHLDIVYALAWVPWLLWTVSRNVDGPSTGRGAQVGAAAALMVLADVRIAFYMLPIAVLYGLAASVAKRRRLSASWKSWTLAIVVLFLLTAVQTVPLLALSPYLTRVSITPREAAEFSLPLRYLLGLFFPDMGGFHEWMTYLGIPLIGLALVALAGRRGDRRPWLWWAVAVLALLWALGDVGPLFLPVVEHIPLAGWFRIPSRAWFVVVISIIIASTYGMERLLERGLDRRGRLIALVVTVAGAAWLAASLVLPALPGIVAGTGAAVLGTGAGLWIAGGGLSDVLVSAGPFAHKKSKLVGLGIVLMTLTSSLVGVDVTLVKARTMAEVEAPEQAIIDKMDANCGSVFSPTFDLLGPAAAKSDLATLDGVDPFQLRWSAENIAAAAGVKLSGYSVIAPPLPPETTDPDGVHLDVGLLRTLGACWVVTRPGISADDLTVYAQVGDVLIYRLPAAPPAVPPGYLLAENPIMEVNTVTAEVCPDTHLTHVVIPQAWAPGWQAWVDGQPASTAAWKGLLVISGEYSPGCHTVKVFYRPLADFAGMGITGITVIGLGVWAIIHRRKEARHA